MEMVICHMEEMSGSFVQVEEGNYSEEEMSKFTKKVLRKV